MASKHQFTTESITLPDGVVIGYRVIGSGPGLILVHGALQSSLNFTRLAAALAGHFTVYIPDRRGRGLSGPYNDTDDLDTEASDIAALASHTGARNIFGLSSGAIVTLKTVINEPSLNKVAIYEPPIPVRGISFSKLDKKYTSAMQKGDYGKAFIAILKGTGSTSFMSKLPAFVTAPYMNRMMKKQSKNLKPGKIALAELLDTFAHDQVVAGQSLPLIEQAAQLNAEILLMGGTKSNRFLKNVLDDLQSVLPAAKRVTFEKEGHLAADNSGNPEKVASGLIKFFGKGPQV